MIGRRGGLKGLQHLPGLRFGFERLTGQLAPVAVIAAVSMISVATQAI